MVLQENKSAMPEAKEGYKPPQEFEKVDFDQLDVTSLSDSDSTELWLIQVPVKEFDPASFAGKNISIKIEEEGMFSGSFENSEGKSYDIANLKSQRMKACAFLPSSSNSLITWKMKRYIQLVNPVVKHEGTDNNADSLVGQTRFISDGFGNGESVSSNRSRPMGNARNQSSQSYTFGESGLTSLDGVKSKKDKKSKIVNDQDTVNNFRESHSAHHESKRRKEERSTGGKKKKKHKKHSDS